MSSSIDINPECGNAGWIALATMFKKYPEQYEKIPGEGSA
jgi:hypothetical protein